MSGKIAYSISLLLLFCYAIFSSAHPVFIGVYVVFIVFVISIILLVKGGLNNIFSLLGQIIQNNINPKSLLGVLIVIIFIFHFGFLSNSVIDLSEEATLKKVISCGIHLLIILAQVLCLSLYVEYFIPRPVQESNFSHLVSAFSYFNMERFEYETCSTWPGDFIKPIFQILKKHSSIKHVHLVFSENNVAFFTALNENNIITVETVNRQLLKWLDEFCELESLDKVDHPVNFVYHQVDDKILYNIKLLKENLENTLGYLEPENLIFNITTGTASSSAAFTSLAIKWNKALSYNSQAAAKKLMPPVYIKKNTLDITTIESL